MKVRGVTMRIARATLAGLLVLALACGGGGGGGNRGEKPASGGNAAAPPPRPATPGGATITGEDKFVGKAPVNPAIDMRAEAKCRADYTTTPHEAIVMLSPNGTLADVS